ncbi:hypothetical protein Bca52824_062455 [Brassica carinata]|uniref:Uncharacterized protein n=1 Tax=Brassica carinata TaxID=52824 RepID=A0A8X7U6C6_BRACI|nr:hypothetical protein Bca52824_062455 [Brassica carinata]
MRRKRIEARKKRKLEEMMVAGLGEETEDGEADEKKDAENKEAEPDASTSGTTMYDTGELKVTVTTSEISREQDEPVRREKTQSTESGSTAKASTSQPAPLRKSKPSKQNRRHKSSTKTMKKRDKKKQARGIKSTRRVLLISVPHPLEFISLVAETTLPLRHHQCYNRYNDCSFFKYFQSTGDQDCEVKDVGMDGHFVAIFPPPPIVVTDVDRSDVVCEEKEEEISELIKNGGDELLNKVPTLTEETETKKPLVSARFSHRKPVKVTLKGNKRKEPRVVKPKRHENTPKMMVTEELESTQLTGQYSWRQETLRLDAGETQLVLRESETFRDVTNNYQYYLPR